MLLVGNHSGGNLTPDTSVFTLAFTTHFGVERRFYQLAHNLVLSMPGLGFLRKYGTVAAVARERRRRRSTAAPRCSSTPAATTRCTGPAGRAGRSTSPAARASSGWRSTRACRWSPWWPSAGRRRRSSSAAASAWPSCCASTRCSASRCCRSRSRCRGASTSATCSATCPLPGEDHDPGARADRPRASATATNPDLDEVYDDIIADMQDTLDRAAVRAPLPRDRLTRCGSRADHDRGAAARRSGSWIGDPASYPTRFSGMTRFAEEGRRSEGDDEARRRARATRCACAWARPTSAA